MEPQTAFSVFLARKGLSSARIATAIGTSKKAVESWRCKDRNPSKSSRAKLATFLGLTIRKLDNLLSRN